MGENYSDDSVVGSKDTQSTRSTRGKICLNGLAQRRVKGIIQEVEFNEHGQSIGKVASEMQSYIGLITREHVKVNHKTWREVPKDVKYMIWETVNLSYKVPHSWRSGCLESACTKWRIWKSRLYHDYIVSNKDNPTKLHAPPPDSAILAVDWGQFVISRMSNEFKKDELYGDDEIDRAIMWKKARVRKEGETKDENVKMAIDRIDKYIREKDEGVFKSKGHYDDLLTCALEKPEHSWCVRGIGAYVNPSTYFKCPRERRFRVDEEQARELENAKKRISKQDHVLAEYDTRMHLQDKLISELLDRIGKLEEGAWTKTKLTEEKGSCSVKLPSVEFGEEYEDYELGEDAVILVDGVATLKGKSVALTVGSSKKIVGYGTVVGVNTSSLHGTPMPKSCVRVAIDESVDENASLPFPIPDVSNNVGNAIGSHVAWPAHLVVAREKGGRGILFSLDIDLLGSECDIWIHFEDIVPFCDLEPISGACIVVYIWHLYTKLKEENTNDGFLFVNPFSISYAPKVQRDERARMLAERLESASSDQLVLVPCNVGEHWILTIIQPHKEHVILMDPLAHRNRDSTWKYVVDIAMNMFNAKLGKKGKKTPNWEVIKGPIQPDSKQCGYYVMRFVNDIVKGLAKDDNISIGSLFNKKEYSKVEIDEIREDWATCVIDHI
ncbi:hypothetical protein C2S52_006880 [Perilla frutescens var. hirtella]|nr:hypothetical protein C2S52_006880 [Perilla frutescens var. hirtella]